MKMPNQFFFYSISFVTLLFIVTGCQNSPSVIDPEIKIQSALHSAERLVETGIKLKKYDQITNEDSLYNAIIDDAGKAKYNSKMMYFATEDCIKKKFADSEKEDKRIRYLQDSILLESIYSKIDEVYDTSLGHPDSLRLIDLILRTTKIEQLTIEMRKVCPTNLKGKLME